MNSNTGCVSECSAAIVRHGRRCRGTRRNPVALRRVDAVLGNRVRTLFSTCDVVELLSPRADLVIATVLVPGSTAPKLFRPQ